MNFLFTKTIILSVTLFLFSTLHCIAAPPSPTEVADTIKDLWKNNNVTELGTYLENLYNSHPNYVPAILAKWMHYGMFLGKHYDEYNMLFKIVIDVEAHPDEYSAFFAGEARSELKSCKDGIASSIRQGYNPEQMGANPQLVRDAYENDPVLSGYLGNYPFYIFFFAPNRDIPIPTTPNDDVQIIPVGQGQPNTICIDSGSNGVCETFAQGDDVQLFAASYEIVETTQNNTEDEGATNPPPAAPSAPAAPAEGCYKLVDSSGEISGFLSLGNSDVFETLTNFNLSTLTNEIPIAGEIQMTDAPPPTEYPKWMTENFEEGWWGPLYKIENAGPPIWNNYAGRSQYGTYSYNNYTYNYWYAANQRVDSSIVIPPNICGPICVLSSIDQTLNATLSGDDNFFSMEITIYGPLPEYLLYVAGTIQVVGVGVNGVCETVATGNDIQVRPCVGPPCQPAISTGPDGICNTVVRGDDTQIILTNCGNSGATCVTAGPNLIRETHEKGDDVVDGTSILVGDNGVCESDANH